MTDPLTADTPRGAFAVHDAFVAELATVLLWAGRGELVGALVSWPAAAASWLRPATRLADDADTGVVADLPRGWAGLGPRLATTPRRDPARTVAFAPPADPDRPCVAGRAATEGSRGATHTGEVWRYRHGLLVVDPPPTTTAPPTEATAPVGTAGRTPCSS